MAHHAIHRPATSTRPLGRFSPINLLIAAFRARRSRAQLSALDDRMLEDVGITPREAAREHHKPLWDVPAHWLK